MADSAVKVRVTVELFGVPRLRAGRRQVTLDLPSSLTMAQVVEQLAEACPQLRGTVLRDDLLGLKEGYVFNLNGLSVLRDNSFILQTGDSLLLMSSQAGG